MEEGSNDIIGYLYIMQVVLYSASFSETLVLKYMCVFCGACVLPAYCNLPVHLLELVTYLISQ